MPRQNEALRFSGVCQVSVAVIQSEWLSIRFPKSVDAHVTIFFTSNDSTCKDAGVEVRVALDLIGHDFFKKIFEGLAVEIFSDPLRDCDVTEADVSVSIRIVVIKIVLEVAQPNLE